MVDMEQRHQRISKIILAIKEAFSKDFEVEFDKLVYQTCFTYKTARRTSLEYINIAISQIDCEIVKDKGKKWIIPLQENKSLIEEA
jgi:hypothetical protein